MTGITTTITTTNTADSEGPRSLDPQNPVVVVPVHDHHHDHDHGGYSSSFLSPRYYNGTRNSANPHPQNQTLPFLRTCGLCNRRLSHGRDIYMYRGDTAFCSQECREQQIKVDERKEKRAAAINAASKNADSHRNHSELAATAGSEASGNGETVAAA